MLTDREDNENSLLHVAAGKSHPIVLDFMKFSFNESTDNFNMDTFVKESDQSIRNIASVSSNSNISR